MRRLVRFYLGYLLIFSSLAIFAWTYYPLVYLFLPTEQRQIIPGYSIFIPKISVFAKITPNVDPWNQKEYRAALNIGVAEARGGVFPGENGTIYLFAHSSLAPGDITKYNVAFFRLGELQRGDRIKIFRNSQEFEYIVREKKEIWPSEVNVLKDLSKKQLILQTCTPIGTSLKRLLVFADPI